MKKEILVRLPKLNDCNGDLTKKWFIFYSVRNPKTGKMERFKDAKDLHKLKSEQDRRQKAKEKIEHYTEKLKLGWTPFDDNSEVIYSDQIEYDHIASMYGRKRASNKNFRYFASKLIEKKSGLERDTVVTYKSKLRRFSQWLEVKGIAQNHIESITNSIIVDFFKWLIDEQKLSAVTVKKYTQMLREAFDIAIDAKVIASNPVFNIPSTTINCDHAARPIHEYDITKFLDEIDGVDTQLGLSIRFEFNCMMRPKEIRFMQIKWIDFSAGTITVPKHMLKTKHDRIAVIPKKFLELLIKEHKLHHQPKEFYVIGQHGKPNDMHLGKNTMRYRFNKMREKLGMPLEYKYYSWKHSGNVRAERDDMPMIARMHQNGHTSIQTTEVYTRNKIGRAAREFEGFDSI